MGYWLFEKVVQEDDERTPQFALQSTSNWLRALQYEIEMQHGSSSAEQLQSCIQVFASRAKAKGSQQPLAQIYEPLFYSLTFATSLASLARSVVGRPWVYPTAVVAWYYSYFNAFRCLFATDNQAIGDTHSALSSALNSGLRPKLPHPLNMVATRVSGEKYEASFPDFPATKPYDLLRSFTPDRQIAQGMLLQYLSGTSNYEADKTKRALLKQHKGRFGDFRTKAAREIRDSALQDTINFLHCAFRYRGKANYRDAIYIAYGAKGMPAEEEFRLARTTTAQFASICAIAYIKVQTGKKNLTSFLEDLRVNFRGFENLEGSEKFWAELQV